MSSLSALPQIGFTSELREELCVAVLHVEGQEAKNAWVVVKR